MHLIEKVRPWDELKEDIERGKKGLNTGIPFEGFTSFSDHIKNIQQARYDLIFANTSVGKSAFVNSTYVYGAIDFLQANPNYIHKLKIIYYSLEINPEHQIAKHIASLIWKDYGILTSLDEIRSVGNLTIRPEVDILLSSYEEKMQEIQDKYIKFRSSLNPDYLFKDLMNYAEKHGRFIKDSEGYIIKYIPSDPSLITEVIIDHIGLIDIGKYGDIKSAIDQTSKYLVFFRKVCKFTIVVISQVNRNSEQMNRRDNEDWMPMLADIKNSGNMAEDAQTVIGLASPHYLKIDNCLGYDITKYKDRYRIAKILKNRDGRANLLASFLFIGEYGGYYQLPDAKELMGQQPQELKRINEYYARNRQ